MLTRKQAEEIGRICPTTALSALKLTFMPGV
jgi:hypothetical protein